MDVMFLFRLLNFSTQIVANLSIGIPNQKNFTDRFSISNLIYLRMSLRPIWYIGGDSNLTGT
jgi:hypothetical protein